MINDRTALTTDLTSLVASCLRELAVQQDLTLPGDIGTSTQLFGPGGLLDSLALVALVVAVEQAVEDEFGVSLSLADERALSQRHSPYRTVGTLAEYAGTLIQEAS
jgi:acyl carrier protein